MQILDIELLRALYINYLCNKTEPCDPQRFITAMEASLESAPQALIQMIYLVKTNSFNSSIIILISFLSSIWSIITKLVSDDKIIVALDSANEIAQKLASNPTDIGLIEDLDKRLIFIANVCGAENKYKTVIDNGGLILLPTCFQALNEAKDCLAQEHAIKS